MLDAYDRKISACLQRDNRQSLDQIAEKIGLSPSATHRRAAQLRSKGVLKADVAILDPKAFGLDMTFIVTIALEKVRIPEVAAVKAKLKATPEIQQIYNITGEADLLAIVLARDVEHFEQISRRAFSSDPRVRRYTTSVVMDRVKVGLTIPVEA